MSALRKLQKICDQNPTSILFARLADGLLQRGEIVRAIEVCHRGLRYRPSYATGHVVLGKCYLAVGHYEEARLVFQRVLQLDAGHLAAHWYMGKIALQLGCGGLALKYFEQAQTRDPFSPELIEQIRKLKSEGVEKERDSRPESSNANTDSGDQEVISGSEAFAQALLEEDVEGVDTLVMSLNRGPKSGGDASVIATKTLAELYASQGLIQEAIAVLEEMVAREPNNGHIIVRLNELRNLSEREE